MTFAHFEPKMISTILGAMVIINPINGNIIKASAL